MCVLYCSKDRTVHNFLATLRVLASDTNHIEMLFDKTGIQNRNYLEIFATMDMCDLWLRELQKGGRSHRDTDEATAGGVGLTQTQMC